MAREASMRLILVSLLIAGCQRQHRPPQNAQLGQSTAAGPAKPIAAPEEGPQNVEVPISGARPAGGEPAPGPAPGPSEPD